MAKLDTGFSKLNDDGLFHLGTTVVTNVGANAKFASLGAPLPPIKAAVSALAAAMSQSHGTRHAAARSAFLRSCILSGRRVKAVQLS